MSGLISNGLMPRARSSLKKAMIDQATVLRTGTVVPCLAAVMRLVPAQTNESNSFHLRVRRWRVIMPHRTDPDWQGTWVAPGDRISVPGHGVYMVTEMTDPNTHNASTDVVCLLCNAQVVFSRPGTTAEIGPVDVYISRNRDELESYGLDTDWEVWFDTSIRYPAGTRGGLLLSKQDQMTWTRLPNPFGSDGVAVLDSPRYAYTSDGALGVAAFKEPK